MAGTSWPSLVPGAKAKATEVELKFDWLEGNIVSMVGGTKFDATYDLGESSFRWRDGRFSRYLYCDTQFLARAAGDSAVAPGYSWKEGTSTGFYMEDSNDFRATVAGNNTIKFRNTDTSFLFPIKLENGSYSVPSIAFNSSPSFGLGRIALSGSDNLYVAKNGTPVMLMSENGHLTTPLKSCFNATMESLTAAVTGDGTNYTITTAFTEIFDQGGDFSSGVFTARTAGKYQFNFSVELLGMTTTINAVNLFLNIDNGAGGLVNVHRVRYTGLTGFYHQMPFAGSCIFEMLPSYRAWLHIVASGGPKTAMIGSGNATNFSGTQIS